METKSLPTFAEANAALAEFNRRLEFEFPDQEMYVVSRETCYARHPDGTEVSTIHEVKHLGQKKLGAEISVSKVQYEPGWHMVETRHWKEGVVVKAEESVVEGNLDIPR